MPAKADGERLDRLEEIVQALAEGQLFLEKLVAELATETRRGFDQVAAQFRETGEHFREVKERFRETDERFRPQTSSFAQPMNGSIKWYRQLAS